MEPVTSGTSEQENHMFTAIKILCETEKNFLRWNIFYSLKVKSFQHVQVWSCFRD